LSRASVVFMILTQTECIIHFRWL